LLVVENGVMPISLPNFTGGVKNVKLLAERPGIIGFALFGSHFGTP